MAAAIVSASFPAVGPAVVEAWRYIKHGVNACRGRAAKGNAARSRQGLELRTRHEEDGLEGLGSPQQHPDEVEGSFHRLYSKGQNGSAVTHVGEHSEPGPSIETKDLRDESSSLPVTVKGDSASEEVPLSVFLQQKPTTHANKQ